MLTGTIIYWHILRSWKHRIDGENGTMENKILYEGEIQCICMEKG